MNKNIQLTWDFIGELSKAQDVDAIRAVIKALAAQYGMETIFGGVIPRDFSQEDDLSKLILVADIPLDWAARYLAQGYVHKDPVVEFMNTEGRHYSWDEAFTASRNKAGAKIIHGEASSFGMKEGLVVPVRMLDGNSAIMSFGGEKIEISPEEKGALAFATNYAVGQLIYQHWQPKGDLRSLSPRETDCLLWASEGKSDWEVSVILGIGVSTVEKHMTSARYKLNAVNKAQAIANAFRYHILR